MRNNIRRREYSDVEEKKEEKNLIDEAFDESLTKDRILRRVQINLPRPGSAYYIPFVKTGESITLSELCSAKERFRRRQVKNKTVIAKIFINGKKVGSSTNASVNFPEFDVSAKLDIEVKLLEIPLEITCELFFGGLFGRKIATLNLPMKAVYNFESTVDRLHFQSETMMISPNRYMSMPEYNLFVKPTGKQWYRPIRGSVDVLMSCGATEDYLRRMAISFLLAFASLFADFVANYG